MIKLIGKKQSFDLSGGTPGKSRDYFVCDMNFLAVQKYTDSTTYDYETGLGEQREANERHVEHLKNEIVNLRYTPDTFKFMIPDNAKITEKNGVVEVTIDENSKLKLMDGGHRKSALHKLWSENANLRRTVENLPIPSLINLNGDSKQDFINYQKSRKINQSQLLSMMIDVGDVKGNKELFTKGRELVKLSNTDVRSPFYRMVKFTEASTAPLAFSSLLTTRKGDLLGSFYFSARLVELHQKTNEWFQTFFDEFYEYVKTETTCAEAGNLLCGPPNGAKGCSNLLLGSANMFCYYLYLHSRQKPLGKDYKVLAKALEVYSAPVAGDLGGLRRQTLARNFSEILYKNIADDPDSTMAFHHDIPVGLIVITSHSCFGIESPGKVLLTPIEEVDDNEYVEKPTVSPIYQIHIDSDTDEEFLNET